MKVLKFYMNSGVPQALTIEEILGYQYESDNLPHIVRTTIKRMSKEVDNYKDIPWSYSKFVALKGKPVDYWYNISCSATPYQFWNEYEDYCASHYLNVVDDVLETILESPAYSQENYMKVIINQSNEEEYGIEDYIKIREIKL